MSRELRQNYCKELGWKSIIFYIGFLGFLNIGYWIIQFIAYQLYAENRFFSKRFYKINYFFGWIYSFFLIAIMIGFISAFI